MTRRTGADSWLEIFVTNQQPTFRLARGILLHPKLSLIVQQNTGVSPGQPAELASFLWRMMLNTLPTQAKLHKMWTVQSSVGKMNGCDETGTQVNELLFCSKNDGVGWTLLSYLQEYVPGLQMNFWQLWSCRLDCRVPNRTFDTHTDLWYFCHMSLMIYHIWQECQICHIMTITYDIYVKNNICQYRC